MGFTVMDEGFLSQPPTLLHPQVSFSMNYEPITVATPAFVELRVRACNTAYESCNYSSCVELTCG